MSAKKNRILLVLAATVLAGTAARAQEKPTPKDEPQHYAWDGTKQDGPALLKEIAAARVAMDVEGSLGAIEKTLDELWLRACEVHGFEGQAEALVQVALARAELYKRLGQREKVLAATRDILIERIGAAKVDVKVVPASNEILVTLAGVEKDPRIVKCRFDFEHEAQQKSGQGESSLNSIVDAVIAGGSWEQIRNIGAPAADRLAQRLLETADGFPNPDLMQLLVQIDERRAVHFMLEHFDAGGLLWKKRMLHALVNAVTNDGTWTRNEPFVFLEPELLKLFEQLLASPETARDVLPFLPLVETRDALTPGLVAALVHGISSFGSDFATATLQLFDHESVSAASQPVLEAALALSDARLRRFAAEKLVHYERSDALLACADDPDPIVRQRVAEALGSHVVLVAREGKTAEGMEWHPPITARDLPTLRRLLADNDDEVRRLAVGKLNDLEGPLEAAVYDKLTKDPAPGVRRALVWVRRVPPEARSAMLGTLARDSADEVIATVDQSLAAASKYHEGGAAKNSNLVKDPRPYLPALEGRFSSTQKPLDSALRSWLSEALAQSDEGVRALISWAFAAGNPAAVVELKDRVGKAHLLALPDELLARVLATSSSARSGPWQDLWLALDEAQPRRSAAMRMLVANASASRTVRLAAVLLAADGTPAFRDALLKFLELPTWKEQPLDESERAQLVDAAQRLAGLDRNALGLAVARDAAIPIDVATAFVGLYPLDAPGSRELTQAVLERWFRPEVPPCQPVHHALRHLGSLPDLAKPELLQRALTNPGYSDVAIEAMRGLADPAYVPSIGRALRAEWMPTDQRVFVQRDAARALNSFQTDQAAELLLEGLRSSDEEVREACRVGLDRIEEYNRRARAWRDRATAAPTKESALAELVTMLADKDPVLRRQAALGLATLGAVETIPQLIRLLKDPDANVSQAAQQALDRLNASKKEAETSGG